MTTGVETVARVARNAVLKVAVQGTRLISLGFLILAARVLGPEEFGKLTFAYALATVLGAALDLGLPSLLIRGVARAREATATRWRGAVTLKLTLLAPAGLAFALFPVLTHRPDDTIVAVWLLGLAIALQSFAELAVAVFTAFERLEFELGLRIVEKLLLLAVGLTGLGLGGGLMAVVVAFAVAALAAAGVGTWLVHRRFTRLRWRGEPGATRALARELGPVAIGFLLAFATTRLVPLLVALLAGDAAAGHFGAAIRVLDVFVVAPVALVAAVYPLLARTPPTEARFRRAYVQSGELLLLLGLPLALGLGVGGRWLVEVVYGARYAPAGPLLTVLGLAVCLSFLNYFLGFVFLALDRPWRLLAVSAIGLAASVVLTPWLVRGWGAAGGAAALVAVESVALAGGLLALAPLVGVPFGIGALKLLGAAAGGLAGAAVAPGPDVIRLGAALLLYAGLALALRPVPGVSWRQLVRGAVWASERR